MNALSLDCFESERLSEGFESVFARFTNSIGKLSGASILHSWQAHHPGQSLSPSYLYCGKSFQLFSNSPANHIDVADVGSGYKVAHSVIRSIKGEVFVSVLQMLQADFDYREWKRILRPGARHRRLELERCNLELNNRDHQSLTVIALIFAPTDLRIKNSAKYSDRSTQCRGHHIGYSCVGYQSVQHYSEQKPCGTGKPRNQRPCLYSPRLVSHVVPRNLVGHPLSLKLKDARPDRFRAGDRAA